MYSLYANAGLKSFYISSKLYLIPSTCWDLLRSCTSNLTSAVSTSTSSSSSLLSYSIWSKIFLISSNSLLSDFDSIFIFWNSIRPSCFCSSGSRSLPKKSNAGTDDGTSSFSSPRSISTSSISKSIGAREAISSRWPICKSRLLAAARLLPKLMLFSLLL